MAVTHWSNCWISGSPSNEWMADFTNDASRSRMCERRERNNSSSSTIIHTIPIMFDTKIIRVYHIQTRTHRSSHRRNTHAHTHTHATRSKVVILQCNRCIMELRFTSCRRFLYCIIIIIVQTQTYTQIYYRNVWHVLLSLSTAVPRPASSVFTLRTNDQTVFRAWLLFYSFVTSYGANWAYMLNGARLWDQTHIWLWWTTIHIFFFFFFFFISIIYFI